MNYWTAYTEMCKEIEARDKAWKAEKRTHEIIDNTGFYIREQLRKGYGTACNPYTSALGVYR